jgi:hypothetical protein
MNMKIDVSMPSKRAAIGIASRSSSLVQVKRTSRLKLVGTWSVVTLPLAWGLYVTGQIAAPLIRMLLFRSH